jgi:hypothetical protein
MGSCYVAQSVTGVNPRVSITGLDAGTITLSGPAGSQQLTPAASQPGAYESILPKGLIPAAGGSFVFNGDGGKDVRAFSTTISYSNPIVWTNMGLNPSVDRASGVTVTWSGGAPMSYMLISGTSTSATIGSFGSVSAGFICYAPVSADTFTVPPFVLLGMPAGKGSLTVENVTTPGPIYGDWTRFRLRLRRRVLFDPPTVPVGGCALAGR